MSCNGPYPPLPPHDYRRKQNNHDEMEFIYKSCTHKTIFDKITQIKNIQNIIIIF